MSLACRFHCRKVAKFGVLEKKMHQATEVRTTALLFNSCTLFTCGRIDHMGSCDLDHFVAASRMHCTVLDRNFLHHLQGTAIHLFAVEECE